MGKLNDSAEKIQLNVLLFNLSREEFYNLIHRTSEQNLIFF